MRFKEPGEDKEPRSVIPNPGALRPHHPPAERHNRRQILSRSARLIEEGPEVAGLVFSLRWQRCRAVQLRLPGKQHLALLATAGIWPQFRDVLCRDRRPFVRLGVLPAGLPCGAKGLLVVQRFV